MVAAGSLHLCRECISAVQNEDLPSSRILPLLILYKLNFDTFSKLFLSSLEADFKNAHMGSYTTMLNELECKSLKAIPYISCVQNPFKNCPQ